MKDMPVGKKILTGFMIAILMIGIILAMTVITSMSRNNDLQRVDNMSNLQVQANKMLNMFNLARVEIHTLFTSIDAEEEHDLALQYLDECMVNLEQMNNISAALGGYEQEDLAALEDMFSRVRASVMAVGENDKQAHAALSAMTESGELMSTSSAGLFDLVTKLTLDAAATDPTAAIDRINKIVIPAKTLGDAVEDTNLAARSLSLQQDVSVIPDLNAQLDSLESSAAPIRSVLVTEEGRQSIDELTGAIGGFRSSIAEVGRIMGNSETEIADARAIFLELNDLANRFVDTISSEVSSLNQSVMDTSHMTMLIVTGVTAAAVVISVLIANFIGRLITRPLNRMKDVMLQVGSSGDLRFSDEAQTDMRKEARGKDEIGQSLLAFTGLIDHITAIADKLEMVANKDLTAEVELLSNGDTMGLSLQSMLKNLNHMFSEMHMIAAQVSAAAGEVSTGAQALARGSTEQAATVQEISASVNEINEQMRTSNETVTAAAAESESISQMALSGNEEMRNMVRSMQEITEASQAIERVIKVIDDIAFQTNILALNAAVEAARAGSAGQGFAVVADEVRNLAAKSAEAAKETAALISANIEKTQNGLTTTQETADGLAKIMEGIEKNRDSLHIVAEQSGGVRTATAEVNTAVDQVAQVIQQNSATSQQSAAASQQMSAQAQGLRELVSQFKLKKADAANSALNSDMPAENDFSQDIDDSLPEDKY
jgi:methyl-accepting chemotaxis protein